LRGPAITDIKYLEVRGGLDLVRRDLFPENAQGVDEDRAHSADLRGLQGSHNRIAQTAIARTAGTSGLEPPMHLIDYDGTLLRRAERRRPGADRGCFR
jgi:hypothetical protein